VGPGASMGMVMKKKIPSLPQPGTEPHPAPGPRAGWMSDL